MIAIMIPIKPYWYAKILNGEKNIEVRKNKALAMAIQKLVDTQGCAPILGYCTKGNSYLYEMPLLLKDGKSSKWFLNNSYKGKEYDSRLLNGKVVAKFTINNLEEIKFHCLTKTNTYGVQRIETTFTTQTLSFAELKKLSCLTGDDLMKYLNDTDGYAIHISQLEIFDRPKELREFYKHNFKGIRWDLGVGEEWDKYRGVLTKAPQNYCYVEVNK